MPALTPVALDTAAASLLESARSAPSGRAARSLVSEAGGALSQTLLALRQGEVLAEHTAPGPATLSVLVGVGTLRVAGAATRVRAGEWVPIPNEVHDVLADEDVVLLLTVAPRS